MKICLGKDVPVNNGDPTVKIKYTEKDFLNAVEKISNNIKKCYGDKKIGLIGLARGGLPLTVAVSHRLDIREISVVQIKMTKSNKKWDYGSPEWINGYINENVDGYIIFEDIVSHGRSVNLLVNELKKQGKEVFCIYSLFLNSEMKKLKLDNETMDIKYVDLINQNQWVNFFWEKGYLEDN